MYRGASRAIDGCTGELVVSVSMTNLSNWNDGSL